MGTLSFSAQVKSVLDKTAHTDKTTAKLCDMFIKNGSVSDPKREKHLEISVSDSQAAMDTVSLIEGLNLGFNPKVGRRHGSYIVYFKKSDDISGFLGFLGAQKALLDIESLRVQKSVQNDINRRVNCENANMDKSIGASVNQMKRIRLIQRTIGLDALDMDIRETARLRLENPSLSIKELGEISTPKIGKSGVNHRLRRINAIAEHIMEGNNGNRNC